MGFAKGFIAGVLSLTGIVVGAAIVSAIKEERATKISDEADEEKETEANEDEMNENTEEMSSLDAQEEGEW